MSTPQVFGNFYQISHVVIENIELRYFAYHTIWQKYFVLFFFFSFGPLRSSEKSENIIGLDSYILNSLDYLNSIWINISHCLTSLLKLKITVYFLAFIASSFRVTEDYPKQVYLARPLSCECFHYSQWNSLLYSICCHCSWCCSAWQP